MEPMDSIAELRALADLAIQTLDQQQAYFKSRTFVDLGASKQLEQQLRKSAELALAEVSQPTLFTTEEEL